jgi:hypothetical protein
VSVKGEVKQIIKIKRMRKGEGEVKQIIKKKRGGRGREKNMQLKKNEIEEKKNDKKIGQMNLHIQPLFLK